ncbi:MAG: DsbA family oxidoreductase [Lachnospiraceae bacterium]
MKIDIWTDYVCPFCYLGKTKLELALKEFRHADEVVMEFHSFELDRNQGPIGDHDINHVISEKYNISYEAAKRSNDRIVAEAKKVGLDYRFDLLKTNNTLLAHEITQFAKEKGKDKVIVHAFFHEYFENGLDIGDRQSLFAIAKQFGLEENELDQRILDGSLEQKVREDEATANQLSIEMVPHFLIDQKFVISGGQAPEVFLSALNEIYEKHELKESVSRFR